MATQSLEDLNFRKGQLDVLHWLRTLEKLSEETWEQLNNEDECMNLGVNKTTPQKVTLTKR